jgi:hypothetical protein
MKTSELQGAALDWAVALAEGATDLYHDTIFSWFFTLNGASRTLNPGWPTMAYNPSTDWALMGPIIEREHISLNQRHDGWWVACIQYNYDDEARSIELSHWPLISAARCYVASKLGDDVVIPEELN